ncbi:MAG TPA: orotate phosphoribosyltransferase [Vampirovibrionales bacterium]
MKLNFEIAEEEAKQKLKKYIQDNCIFYGDFTLASGKKSNFYLDMRLLTLSSQGVTLCSTLLLQKIQNLKNENISAVAGPTMGADPIVSGVSQLSYMLGEPLNSAYIRKESKGHGRQKLVEGPVKEGEEVVVLEDVITTGKSSLKAVNAIREFGCKTEHLICLVLRDKEIVENLEKEANLKVHYLFEVSELLDESKISAQV